MGTRGIVARDIVDGETRLRTRKGDLIVRRVEPLKGDYVNIWFYGYELPIQYSKYMTLHKVV
jgi:hypothetical protein